MTSREPINISVRAVPHDGQYMIECSDCGPVGVVPSPDSDEACLNHLEAHDVDTGPYRRAQ